MMTKPEQVLKYCPKCGSASFSIEGEKSFLCTDCGFHFFINSASAVAALIENEKGELLLTVRAFEPNVGMLDLPGGFVDPMETAEQALTRELKEELNLDTIEMQYLVSYPNEYVYSGYSVFTTDLAFVCKVKGWEHLHAKDDVTDINFVTKENINWDRISAVSIRRIIETHWGIQSTESHC